MNLLKMKNDNRIPAIAIIPYRSWPTFGLRNISLDNLEWPLGRPKRLQDGNISDLTEIDHIITFPRKHIYFMMRYKVRARISLMIVEPDITNALDFATAGAMPDSIAMLSEVLLKIETLPAGTW